MPRTCLACASPLRAEIDAAIIAKEPFRRIAARASVSETSIRRHAAHLPAILVKATEAAEVARGDHLLVKVHDLETEARRIGKKAEDAGDLKTALGGIRELTRIVELLAKLHGGLKDGPTVNILVTSPEWLAIRSALLTALLPFPQAKLAVAEALRRLNGAGA
jgi:hypothetical protein